MMETNINGTEIKFINNGLIDRVFSNKICYEDKAFKTIMKYIKEDSIFVDVGAFMGVYSCLFGKASPKGKVYSFEINYNVIKKIKENIEVNNLSNIEVFNLGLLDIEKTVWIAKGNPHPDLSLYIEEDKEKVLVDCITLDEFFKDKPKPNIIKIDTEGAEQFILQGMTEILKNGVVILLEMHGGLLAKAGGSFKDIAKILKRYKIYHIVNAKDWDRNTEPILKEVEDRSRDSCKWSPTLLVVKEEQSLVGIK